MRMTLAVLILFSIYSESAFSQGITVGGCVIPAGTPVPNSRARNFPTVVRSNPFQQWSPFRNAGIPAAGFRANQFQQWIQLPQPNRQAIRAPNSKRRKPGAKILSVTPNSPAARAKIRPGDVISAINRQPITSMADYYTQIGKKGSLQFTLVSGQTGRVLHRSIRPVNHRIGVRFKVE